MARNTATPVQTDAEVIADYVSADRSGRAKFRNDVQRRIMDAARALDVTEAARLAGLLDAATAAAAEAAGTAVVVDWSALIADRAATLRAAADALLSGDALPEGMPSDAEVSYPLDAGTADSDAAQVIASRRVRRGGVQRDVSEFIATRVAMQDSDRSDGTLTVADLRRGQDSPPSSGAISQALRAMLDGTRSIDGVEAVAADSDAPLRARRA